MIGVVQPHERRTFERWMGWSSGLKISNRNSVLDATPTVPKLCVLTANASLTQLFAALAGEARRVANPKPKNRTSALCERNLEIGKPTRMPSKDVDSMITRLLARLCPSRPAALLVDLAVQLLPVVLLHICIQRHAVARSTPNSRRAVSPVLTRHEKHPLKRIGIFGHRHLNPVSP